MLAAMGLFAAVGVAVGQPAATAPSAGARAATMPAGSAVKAAVEYGRAVAAGDVARVRRLVAGNDAQKQSIEAMASMMGGMKQLADAANAKFGDNAKELGALASSPDDMTKLWEAAEEKVEGDTATLTARGVREPLRMKLVEGRWLVDLNAGPEQQRADFIKGAPHFKVMGDIARQVAGDLGQGRYKSVEEVRTALEQRMTATIAGASSTRPTTRP